MAELNGKTAYFFSIQDNLFVPLEKDHLNNTYIMEFAFSVPNPNDILLSKENINSFNKVFRSIDVSCRNIERTDPILIQVVEELKEDANVIFFELTIIEIPDGVIYDILDHDGKESVREISRSWS